MLEIVSKGFRTAKNALSGKAEITESNIEDAVRQIRVSLLEGDVELGVVRTFISRVKERALGEVVQLAVTKDGKKQRTSPGEHFVYICHNELEKLMGPVEEDPIVFHRPYTIIMMVGLQGTGKTTTTGKLARSLLNEKRKPLLVAADIYRPAAVDQLKKLGEQLDVPVFHKPDLAPPALCVEALREAKKRKRDVVIFDTAGRLAIDDELMDELEQIKGKTKPHNIFLVVDAMAGQDSVKTASEFNRRLDLSGFIMTKLDGDARGGAALSIKEVTGKPIKFLGMGESLDKLERFRPEGLASRILGMGDIVGLMEEFEQVIDEKEAERDTKKLLKGQFTLDDFLKQLRMLKKVGSVSEIYEKFPIFGDQLPDGAQLDDKAFVAMESMIQSMTPTERTTPQMIDKSRASRIAKGSGRKPEAVLDLVQRFGMMHTLMQNFASQPGLLNNLPGFKQLGAIRKMKGMDMGDVLGDMKGGLPGLPQGMGMPAMPPGMGAPGPGQQVALPPGVTMAQYQQAMQAQMRGMSAPPKKVRTAKDKEKARNKRKQEKRARKRSRKR
ncbi:MAG: signal recognition particle protein [Myxococcota bacterium]